MSATPAEPCDESAFWQTKRNWRAADINAS